MIEMVKYKKYRIFTMYLSTVSVSIHSDLGLDSSHFLVHKGCLYGYMSVFLDVDSNRTMVFVSRTYYHLFIPPHVSCNFSTTSYPTQILIPSNLGWPLLLNVSSFHWWHLFILVIFVSSFHKSSAAY